MAKASLWQKEPYPFHKSCFHCDEGAAHLIACSHQVLKPSVWVTCSLCYTHCRHCYGCLVGCCLSLFIGKGPVCIWKVRFAMDTRLSFRESFQKKHCFRRESAGCYAFKPINNGSLVVKTIPLFVVQNRAVVICNRCCTPVIPKPHDSPIGHHLFTLPSVYLCGFSIRIFFKNA